MAHHHKNEEYIMELNWKVMEELPRRTMVGPCFVPGHAPFPGLC